ncbi:unnamed protein product (macronuclear) [Paramecium tetraurelia]|uniref:C2H2-type domain-containing protein n=1 Tax=Paramecium tetraurelia TaxID=5888 RepID=A0BE34_PARTE|nr:uncharacterized protein GSPATT00027833001 [Paramecium tetraurelia]CAK56801.1 unnamed protein product [Paramecium tetraurelia]|eukprot:XP_001424199.1 hypothetical protein (macronuclear) [Paramecium tetraurelia strain d4-2]
MQQQTIQDIETQANQLLESVYQRKSDMITTYSKLKRQEEALDLGFASVGFPDESMDCEAVYEILQPGFIFEVIVSKKNIAKGRLDVILQKFLAFSDKCITSQHQVRQADFQQFKRQKHLLSQLTQINVMRMKGVIYEQDVIEDFSIFTYYINFEKIQVGDHLNAVLIDKTKMTMSLKNKSILGGKQWSLKSLQNPSEFDSWLYFRLGYAKQIGVNFQYQMMSEEEKQKTQEQINANLKFKEETGILKMDYQIEQDGFFPNKQNYPFMMQSLGLSQNTSFTNRNNIKSFMKINLDHRRRLYQIIYYFQTFKSICLARCPIDLRSQAEESKQQLKNNNIIIFTIINSSYQLNLLNSNQINYFIIHYASQVFKFFCFRQESINTYRIIQSISKEPWANFQKQNFSQLSMPPWYNQTSNQYLNFKYISFIIPKGIFQEKVTFILQSNSAINTTFINDQQDIILKFQLGNRMLSIITLDRSQKEQKEDDQNMNVYLQQPYPYQQQQKLKIDFKLEDTDEIEVNGVDNIVTILTKGQIKQLKSEQTKKQIQILHLDIANNKPEGQTVQIQFKFLKEWYLKLGNNLLTAKKALQEFFKSLQIPKTKFTAFDNQPPGPDQPNIHLQPDLNKKPSIKPEGKQETEKIQEEVEQSNPIPEKDLQNLFPLVSEEFVQRQRESLEKKNCTAEEKIKRLFEEVRIKQYKQQSYSAEKNFFKCPYHKCQKGYKRPNQLKNHIKQNHQKLSEIGFTIDDNGEYKYNERILDYCLLLWKVYPNFVKSVINEMRQRKEQPSA